MYPCPFLCVDKALPTGTVFRHASWSIGARKRDNMTSLIPLTFAAGTYGGDYVNNAMVSRSKILDSSPRGYVLLFGGRVVTIYIHIYILK